MTAKAQTMPPRGQKHHRPTEMTDSLRWQIGRGILGFFSTLLVMLAGNGSAAESTVAVTLSDGEVLTGQLVSLDPNQLVLDSSGSTQTTAAPIEEQAIGIDRVRQILLKSNTALEGQAIVGLIDGSRIEGDVTGITDSKARLVVAGAELTLETERLHWIAWPNAQELAKAADWLTELPVPAGADLVVIRRKQGWQFIECAITKVTAENVIVLLDGETIPVKRTKLAGICWLRGEMPPGITPEPAPRDILLGLHGGSLRCRSISRATSQSSEWNIELEAIAGNTSKVKLASAAVRSIDYSFGRQIDLTRRPPLSSSSNPYFSALANDTTLHSYFSPRVVTQPERSNENTDSVPGLLVRPRTEMIWGLPPDSRRLLARILPGNTASVSVSVILIEVDGQERLRATIGSDTFTDGRLGLPVDLDIRGGRKLRVLVDFEKGFSATAMPTAIPLLGGPVLIQAPTIER